MNLKSTGITTFLIAFSLLGGCKSDTTTDNGGSSGGNKNPGGVSTSGSIDAQGSTFVQAFLSRAFEEFKNKENFQINYTGGGSSQGIQNVSSGLTLFGASDAPMSEEELAVAKSKVLNLPIVLGNVAIAYNAPGVPNGLKLDGPVIAEIFMLKIKKWNDPKIAAMNPDVNLPDSLIAVQVRADGSGTTYVFSDFLSAVSPEWNTAMGKSKKLNWPSGVFAWPKSDGVAINTQKTPGSIAYMELSWAKQSNLSYAAVKNSAGKFVLPEPAGATAAAEATVGSMPADFRMSIINASGDASYPIASYVFGLIPEDLKSKPQGDNVLKAFEYLVGDAQSFAEELHYAKLPSEVAAKVKAALQTAVK